MLANNTAYISDCGRLCTLQHAKVNRTASYGICIIMLCDKSEKIKDVIKVLKDILRTQSEEVEGADTEPIGSFDLPGLSTCQPSVQADNEASRPISLPAARYWRHSKSYDRQNRPGMLRHTVQSKAGSICVAPSGRRQHLSASRRQNGHIVLSVLRTKMQPRYPAGSRKPSWRKRGLGK